MITFEEFEMRRDQAKVDPVWTGDLADDCTARWAGFLLRAEEMERGSWWFSVCDLSSGSVIHDSDRADRGIESGSIARAECEKAVRRFLNL